MGGRRTLPSSRYADELAIIEATGWTHDEYRQAPYDLIDELTVRLSKRALAQRRMEKAAGKKHG